MVSISATKISNRLFPTEAAVLRELEVQADLVPLRYNEADLPLDKFSHGTALKAAVRLVCAAQTVLGRPTNQVLVAERR